MKQQGKNANLFKILIGILAVLWMVIIFIDHQVHNTYYIKSINFFHHGGMLLALLLTFFVGLLFMNKGFGKSKLQLKAYAGWQVVLLWLLLTIIAFSGVALQADYLADPVGGIAYFTGHLLVLGLACFALILSAFSWGSLLLKILKTPVSGISKSITAIATGFAVIGLILFFLAAIGYYGMIPMIVLLVIPIPLAYKESGKFLRNAFIQKQQPHALNILSLFALFMILLLIGMNTVAMIRPLPIGFDASNLYLNMPHLLSNKQALLEGGQAYNWSLIMGMGFEVFHSTAIALLLSILPGILSIFVVVRIARQIGMKSSGSLIAAALVYALPVISWQSTQEAKVDLALLFYGLTAVMLFLDWLKFADKERVLFDKWWKFSGKQLSLWLVIGLLAGFAIGIKYTSLFFILGLTVALLYQMKGKWHAFLGLYIAMAAVFGAGLYKLTTIPIALGQAFLIAGILILVGVGIFIYGTRKTGTSFNFPLKPIIGFGIITFLVFLPWLGKNFIETRSTTIRVLVTGKSLFPSIDPSTLNTDAMLKPGVLKDYDFIKSYNPHLLAQNGDQPPQTTTKDIRKKQSLESGVYEEIARYIGYEAPLPRYLSVPYDFTMQTNVQSFANGIGFILLLLLPLFVLSVPVDNKSLLVNLGKYALLFICLGISVYAAFLNGDSSGVEAFLNNLYLDSPETSSLHGLHEAFFTLIFSIGSAFSFIADISDYRIVFVVIGLLPLAGYGLYRNLFTKNENAPKALAAFVTTFFMIWLLMGSGISWYGIVGIAVLLVLAMFLLEQGKGVFAMNWIKNIGYLSIGIWLVLMLFLRLTVFNPNGTYSAIAQPFDPHFSQYAAGEKTKKEVMEAKIGDYLPTLEKINAEENLGYNVLRFGTYMHYFIDQNNQRVFIDNQLNVFKFFYDKANGNASEVAQLMKQHDIKFIIFSTRVGGYTEENLMQEKARAFQEFVRKMYQLEDRPINLIYPTSLDQGTQPGYFAYELLLDRI